MVRMLLPRSAAGKGLAVLTAYFDDSGTHATSRVTLMGGLYGNDAQWTALEQKWQALLDDPGKGWGPLARFHMFDCEHGEGEFSGKSQGARDHLIYRFRNIILESRLHGYAMVVSTPDWDELVKGDYLDGWGDAERFSVTNCLLTTLEWAARESVETEVAFVFDDRPQRRESNRRVYSIYQHYSESERVTPKPVGISFLGSEKSLPLQAADMFAWESNRYAQEWLAKREKMRARPHFRHFLATNRFKLQCGTREAIKAMIANVEPGSWKEAAIERLAEYFRASSPNLEVFRRERPA